MVYFSDEDVVALRNSGDFDENWYLEQYPDVKIIGMDPAVHFLWLGKRLGRRPSNHANIAESKARTLQRFDASSALFTPVGARNPETSPSGELDKALNILTPTLRQKIIASGLFNEQYYSVRYADKITHKSDLLADYIVALSHDMDRNPGPLFSTRFYYDTHLDVRDIHPFQHYIEYGMDEGRAAFSTQNVNSFLSGVGGNKLDSIFDIVPKGRPVNILYWEKGNFFFTDVAKFLGQMLTEQGYDVTLRTELPRSRKEEAINVVVAPHEFCALGPGRKWTADQYADAVYVNTEQWQTSWFALSLKFMKLTRRGVLDLNPSSAQGLVEKGMKAAFLPLLPLPGSCFDFSSARPLSPHVSRLKFVEPLTYPDGLDERVYDVLCCGVLNDRRAKALAEMAPVLANHRCFLHVPRFDRPIKLGDPNALSAEDFAQISRNSKIMLNIHQGDSHYLEWQRMFLIGMMQGAVVVSEPCYANAYVQPDVHYIETPLENMAEVVSELLNTAAGRKKMATIYDNISSLRDRVLKGERFL